MNKKQKLTILALTMSLAASANALASGAPTSQFGFKGWPYRQSTGCYSQDTDGASETTCTPAAVTCTPTAVPTSEPTAVPTAEPTTVPTAEPTAVPTAEPTAIPTAEPTPEPTAVPTAEPTAVPTSVPTATPTPKPTAVPTVKPSATPTPKPTNTGNPPSTDDDYTTGSITAQEENAFLLLSQDRAANGRSALTLDPALCDLARLKSRDMFLNNYFSHTSPTYGSAAQMLSTYGYAYTAVGENIAHHASVEKAEAAFMSSTGHRQNILGTQWTKVGIGVWQDSQGYVYVTQLFVR